MTAQTLQFRSRTIDAVDIDRDRIQRLSLRGRAGCDIMRGASVATCALVAAAVLMLAVVAFAPRNVMTAEVASGSDQVTIAPQTR